MALINGPLPGSGGGTSGAAAAGTGETLGSNANKVTFTVENAANAFSLSAHLIANGGTNLPFLTFNAETAQTGYNQVFIYSIGGGLIYQAPGNSSIMSPNNLANTQTADVSLTVSRLFDGTDTHITAMFTSGSVAGYISGITTKTFSGEVDLTAVNIYSNQASGLAAGTVIG